MGKPGRINLLSFISEFIGYESKAGELKHLSNRTKRKQISDSQSSGERNGISLNFWYVIDYSRCAKGVVGLSVISVNMA